MRSLTKTVQAAGLNPATRTHGYADPRHRSCPLEVVREGTESLASGLLTVPHVGGEGGCRMTKKSENRVTSKAVASKASKALTDGRSSDRTKSIAASALSQRKK